jgi:hypothetical protein
MGWASSFLHTSYLILYLGGVVRRKFRYRYLDVPSADLAFFFGIIYGPFSSPSPARYSTTQNSVFPRRSKISFPYYRLHYRVEVLWVETYVRKRQ